MAASVRAAIAQLVERQFCKLRVGGSSPSGGSMHTQTPTLVAIADDTTGALEIGALLASEGFHCAVNLHADDVAATAAAVVDTNTRYAPPETAFAVVSEV